MKHELERGTCHDCGQVAHGMRFSGVFRCGYCNAKHLSARSKPAGQQELP